MCSNELNYDEKGDNRRFDAMGRCNRPRSLDVLLRAVRHSCLLDSFIRLFTHRNARFIRMIETRFAGLEIFSGKETNTMVVGTTCVGDILGMVFCSPLGTVSPEKLWWAASRLGVHSVRQERTGRGVSDGSKQKSTNCWNGFAIRKASTMIEHGGRSNAIESLLSLHTCRT